MDKQNEKYTKIKKPTPVHSDLFPIPEQSQSNKNVYEGDESIRRRSNMHEVPTKRKHVIGTSALQRKKQADLKERKILADQKIRTNTKAAHPSIKKSVLGGTRPVSNIGRNIRGMEEKAKLIENKLLESEKTLELVKEELLETKENLKISEEKYDRLSEEKITSNNLLESKNNDMASKFEAYKEEKEIYIKTIIRKNLDDLRELESIQKESKKEEKSRINEIVEIHTKKIKEKELLLEESREEISNLLGKIKELERASKEADKRDREFETKISDMGSSEMKKDSNIVLLKMEIESLKNTLKEVTLSEKDKHEIIKNLRVVVEERDNDIFTLEKKLKDGEKLRRKLHNEVLELKGNIRVFCRVRPSLKEKEISTENIILPPVPENTMIDIRIPTDRSDISGLKRDRLHHFEFDRIFPPESTQETVFSEIEQLVQSVLDGYRVCIFAYGQTGSGKTYTMEGPEDVYSSENMHTDLGMIPRAVEQIFATCELLSSRGWNFTINTSFLEIYNETIRDLLSQDREEKKHDIKHSETGTTVTGLSIITVTDPISTLSLLKSSAQKRSFASTLCNERSSRSHTVFILQVIGINEETKERVEGVLNLIDLAGSERLSQSGSTGDRLKETQAINKSLSSLGDVISALYNKDAHIPYRNSKLTYLLSKSLGGNSKTLMFANISPETQDLNETLCSLRFATKVNSCEIGTARKKNS
eukprot:GHVP01035374.1.p1 GENE.GHVP01035374.1~~GHVP01035374.1.p1  ORF type:complete len:705 (+),score=149.95 GHVP01035374.1:13-2127(+)